MLNSRGNSRNTSERPCGYNRRIGKTPTILNRLPHKKSHGPSPKDQETPHHSRALDFQRVYLGCFGLGLGGRGFHNLLGGSPA